MSTVSFSIIQTPNNIGAAIRSGDTVALKVIQSLAGGKWQVSCKGKLMAIRSTVPLNSGQWIRTRAEVRGGRILLHLLSASDLTAPGTDSEASLGIPRGGATEMLAQAFRRAGLVVDNHLFERAKTVFENARKKDRTTASVITALAEKRISPETGFVDYIAELLDSPGDEGYRNSRHESTAEEKRPPVPTAESIQKALKSQIERSAEKDGLLQLFNHVGGAGESWILIPYGIRQKGREVKGTIRLRVDKTGNVRRIGIGASTQEATFSCSIDWPMGKTTAVKVRCSDEELLGEFLRRSDELPEKLRNLVSINDDNSIEDEDFDYLSLEHARHYEGVDELA